VIIFAGFIATSIYFIELRYMLAEFFEIFAFRVYVL